MAHASSSEQPKAPAWKGGNRKPAIEQYALRRLEGPEAGCYSLWSLSAHLEEAHFEPNARRDKPLLMNVLRRIGDDQHWGEQMRSRAHAMLVQMQEESERRKDVAEGYKKNAMCPPQTNTFLNCSFYFEPGFAPTSGMVPGMVTKAHRGRRNRARKQKQDEHKRAPGGPGRESASQGTGASVALDRREHAAESIAQAEVEGEDAFPRERLQELGSERAAKRLCTNERERTRAQRLRGGTANVMKMLQDMQKIVRAPPFPQTTAPAEPEQPPTTVLPEEEPSFSLQSAPVSATNCSPNPLAAKSIKALREQLEALRAGGDNTATASSHVTFPSSVPVTFTSPQVEAVLSEPDAVQSLTRAGQQVLEQAEKSSDDFRRRSYAACSATDVDTGSSEDMQLTPQSLPLTAAPFRSRLNPTWQGNAGLQQTSWQGAAEKQGNSYEDAAFIKIRASDTVEQELLSEQKPEVGQSHSDRKAGLSGSAFGATSQEAQGGALRETLVSPAVQEEAPSSSPSFSWASASLQASLESPILCESPELKQLRRLGGGQMYLTESRRAGYGKAFLKRLGPATLKQATESKLPFGKRADIFGAGGVRILQQVDENLVCRQPLRIEKTIDLSPALQGASALSGEKQTVPVKDEKTKSRLGVATANLKQAESHDGTKGVSLDSVGAMNTTDELGYGMKDTSVFGESSLQLGSGISASEDVSDQLLLQVAKLLERDQALYGSEACFSASYEGANVSLGDGARSGKESV